MKKGILKKIIKLLIIIIIPLAAGLVTGSYAYRRYQPTYFLQYMKNASQEDTEDRFISYLNYFNQKVEYEENNEEYEFFYKENVKNPKYDANKEATGKENLFTLSIIRTAIVKNEKIYNKNGTYVGMDDVYYLTYHIAIYNIDYQGLAYVLDPTENNKLDRTKLPIISIELIDKNDEENKKTLNNTTVGSQIANDHADLVKGRLVEVLDYGYSPKRDSKGEELKSDHTPTSMRYFTFTADSIDKFSKDITLDVKVNSTWDTKNDEENKDDSNNVVEDLTKIEFNNFYSNKGINDKKDETSEAARKTVDDFSKGYEGDIFKAGYTKFAIGHYIWWEVLIAVAIFGIVCVSFVLVWNSEDQKETNKNKKTK